MPIQRSWEVIILATGRIVEGPDVPITIRAEHDERGLKVEATSHDPNLPLSVTFFPLAGKGGKRPEGRFENGCLTFRLTTGGYRMVITAT